MKERRTKASIFESSNHIHTYRAALPRAVGVAFTTQGVPASRRCLAVGQRASLLDVVERPGGAGDGSRCARGAVGTHRAEARIVDVGVDGCDE